MILLEFSSDLFLFIWKIDYQIYRLSLHKLNTHLTATTRIWPPQRQQPRTPSRSLTWLKSFTYSKVSYHVDLLKSSIMYWYKLRSWKRLKSAKFLGILPHFCQCHFSVPELNIDCVVTLSCQVNYLFLLNKLLHNSLTFWYIHTHYMHCCLGQESRERKCPRLKSQLMSH